MARKKFTGFLPTSSGSTNTANGTELTASGAYVGNALLSNFLALYNQPVVLERNINQFLKAQEALLNAEKENAAKKTGSFANGVGDGRRKRHAAVATAASASTSMTTTGSINKSERAGNRKARLEAAFARLDHGAAIDFEGGPTFRLQLLKLRYGRWKGKREDSSITPKFDSRSLQNCKCEIKVKPLEDQNEVSSVAAFESTKNIYLTPDSSDDQYLSIGSKAGKTKGVKMDVPWSAFGIEDPSLGLKLLSPHGYAIEVWITPTPRGEGSKKEEDEMAIDKQPGGRKQGSQYSYLFEVNVSNTLTTKEGEFEIPLFTGLPADSALPTLGDFGEVIAVRCSWSGNVNYISPGPYFSGTQGSGHAEKSLFQSQVSEETVVHTSTSTTTTATERPGGLILTTKRQSRLRETSLTTSSTLTARSRENQLSKKSRKKLSIDWIFQGAVKDFDPPSAFSDNNNSYSFSSEGLQCPFCLRKCFDSVLRLQFHLKVNHEYVDCRVDESGVKNGKVKIFVDPSTKRRGAEKMNIESTKAATRFLWVAPPTSRRLQGGDKHGEQGKAFDLAAWVKGDFVWAQNRGLTEAERRVVAMLARCRKRKEGFGDLPTREEAREKKRRLAIPKHPGGKGKDFVTSLTKEVLGAGDMVSDTEDEVGVDEYVITRQDETIDGSDYRGETKEFMKRWARHAYLEQSHVAELMPDTLVRFIRKNKRFLKTPGQRDELKLLLDCLRYRRLIDSAFVNHCLDMLLEVEDSQESVGDPIVLEKKKKRRKDEYILGPPWCLPNCREGWDDYKMIRCSKNTCSVGWYHMPCLDETGDYDAGEVERGTSDDWVCHGCQFTEARER